MDYTFFIYVTENTTAIKEINNDIFKVYQILMVDVLLNKFH